MKALYLARKALLEAWREPQLLGLLLAFPAVMMALYFAAFGNTGQGIASVLKLLVLNEDTGPAGAALVQALRDERYEGKPVFDVVAASSRQAAAITLGEHKAAALLVVPPGFSQAVARARAGAPPARVSLAGDPTSDYYVFAESFLIDILDRVTAAPAEVKGDERAVPVTYSFLPGTGTMSDFYAGVPGLLVFGVLFGAIATAIVIVREEAAGTLARLRLVRAGALDLVAGITLAQAAQATVQLGLAFGVAMLLGFHAAGSLVLALAIALVFSLAATGLGLIAAAFAHTNGEAANLATLLFAPMAFLSGAVFPMPTAAVASVGGQMIQAYDVMPATHAVEALRGVLIYGEGLSELGYPLAAMGALSLLTLALGVWLYQRRKLGK